MKKFLRILAALFDFFAHLFEFAIKVNKNLSAENQHFYRPQGFKMASDFAYSFKANRYVSHDLRLKHDKIARFLFQTQLSLFINPWASF